MAETNSVRMDKWLWAVRVFKTRSLASDACRHGRVTIGGLPVKASRDVRINDLIVVKKDELTRTFKVLQLLQQRVGAPAARDYAEDQTPASELQKAREPRFTPLFFRPKGSGRPTKKERRAITRIIGDVFEESP
jgi:ribosome-associated heat shock protein Hsp15